MIYFIDFEARSLGSHSFPIEVAWVDQDGQCEEYLIRPHPEWLANGCPGWSAASEAVYGISLSTLLADGTPAEIVAARAAAVLSRNAMVVADQPAFDGEWLRELLRVGGITANVDLLNVTEAYAAACRPLLSLLPPPEKSGQQQAMERMRGIATRLIGPAQEHEAVRPRTHHRAFPDADSLWRTWRLVSEDVAALMNERDWPE